MSWTLGKCARVRMWLAATMMILCLMAAGVGRAQVLANPDNPPAQNKEDEKKDAKKDDKKDEKKGLPLKPGRKIEFTTDEGTWLSLDVSPDGKTIAFELLGNIYTMPIEGGEAKAISTGMAFDSQPRFSPDGKWITFISDREGSENIWIMHPDGKEPKQVSKDPTTPSRLRAGRPTGNIFLCRRLDSESRRTKSGCITSMAAPEFRSPRRSRRRRLRAGAAERYGRRRITGRQISVLRERKGPFSYNAQFPQWTIMRRDRKTGDEDALIEQLDSAFRPQLSPDGTKILYVTRYETESELRLRDLNTGDDRWVRYPVTRDDQESLFSRDVFPRIRDFCRAETKSFTTRTAKFVA